MFARWIKFIKTDIWRIRLKDHPRSKSFVIRLIRIIVLAVRGFDENKCVFRASALTFYTLLSIVPIIALMFGIAKGFGLQKQVEEELLVKMEGQKEVVTKIIDFANSLLASASGGVIAGIGVAFLFWTIIRVLSNVENSFNDIWGVVKPRTFGRKFGDYLSMILVCPILLVISGSATIFVSSHVKLVMEKIPLLQNLGQAFWIPLKILPYVTIWVVFSYLSLFLCQTQR
jgi:membrane protein